MDFNLQNLNGPIPFPEPEPFPFPLPFPQPLPNLRDRLPIFELEKIRWPIKYGPAKVKILVVIDSGGSYDTGQDFGLGLMLKDAFNIGADAGTPLPPDYPEYARFEFSLAHRSTGAGTTPGFENFRFSDAKLAGFHEVWLFGISSANPYLQGAELTALTKFMNEGGGVLAMGDHEDLGLGLCGNVPRVKSMRKWWYRLPLPAGESRAPDSDDLTRNDTVQLIGGVDPGFNGQEDGTPQPIYPTYQVGYNWAPWQRVHYPHPVLCGPRGVITIFPDHAHEGDCVVPSVLNPTEYPGRVAPKVIARGRNVVGRTKTGFRIVNPREFGLLGAYDGHLPAANVGRIVVDSTWHHWFNINLKGLDNVPFSVNYRDILAYFRNVAIWLAPKERQNRMRLTGQVLTLFTKSMIERTLSIRELQPELFYPIGIEARDALARIAPQCQANIWLLELLTPQLPRIVDRLKDLQEEEPELWESYVLDRLLTTALGGAMASLAVAARRSDYRDGDSVIEAADQLAIEGMRLGLEYVQKDLTSSREQFGKAIDSVLNLKDRQIR